MGISFLGNSLRCLFLVHKRCININVNIQWPRLLIPCGSPVIASFSQQKRKKNMRETNIDLKSLVSKVTHITASLILLMRSCHMDSFTFKRGWKMYFSHDPSYNPTPVVGEGGLGCGPPVSATGITVFWWQLEELQAVISQDSSPPLSSWTYHENVDAGLDSWEASTGTYLKIGKKIRVNSTF